MAVDLDDSSCKKSRSIPITGRQEIFVAQKDDPNWGVYLGYGFQICAGVLLGLFIGNWLDKRYHWAPWGVLIGVTLGLASGMYLLIRDAIKMNKD